MVGGSRARSPGRPSPLLSRSMVSTPASLSTARRRGSVRALLRARDSVTLLDGALARDEDVARSRMRTARLGEALGIPEPDRTHLAELVAGVAEQALRHGGGQIEFVLTWGSREPMFLIEIGDRGSDVPDPHTAELLAGARAVLDHVHVATTAGAGTTVPLGRGLRESSALSEDLLSGITAGADANAAADPASDVHRRTRELLRSLAAMRRHWAEVQQSARRLTLLDRLGEVFGPLQTTDVLLRSLALTLVPGWADGCVAILDEAKGERIHEVVALTPADGGADAPPVVHQTVSEGESAAALGVDPELVTRADASVVRDALTRAAATAAVDLASLLEHLVVAPLRHRGEPLGVLGVVRRGAPFSADDQAFVASIADRLAVSHHNGRLFANAQGATQSRDRVLWMVAHELRRPLNALSLGIERLKDARDAESEARSIARLEDSVSLMDRLVGDLLDVSSFERGLLSLSPRPLDLGGLVAEVIAELAPRFEAAGVVVEATIDPEPPRVRGDRYRLQQVLGNLLDNALNHAPRGTAVQVAVTRGRGKRVGVTVRDHGPGIPREEQAHVFNAFFRGSQSRRRGMGLGLMIAREIVLGHGGRIWLRSRPGEGATFHFSLPAESPARDAAKPAR